jgi:chemotaxis protein CheX
MKAEYINPFLESARLVMEQMMQVRPTIGQLAIKDVAFRDGHIWIQIGLKGQVNGDVIYGFNEQVALRIVSVMMGGFTLTEIDEIGRSAISELGNMISGNASTIFSSQGLMVEITPPKLLNGGAPSLTVARKALTVPLILGDLGQMELQVLIV